MLPTRRIVYELCRHAVYVLQGCNPLFRHRAALRVLNLVDRTVYIN